MSVDTLKASLSPIQGCNGASAIALYSDDRENVCIETWKAGSHQTIMDHKGIEVVVISGGFLKMSSNLNRNLGFDLQLQPIMKYMFALKVRVLGLRLNICEKIQSLQ